MWQHCSIPHTLLTWFQLIFSCSFDWYQHWRDGTFVMLLTLRMQWTAEKASTKWLPRNVSKNFMALADVYSCTRRLFWRNCSLNGCTASYFSEIKLFLEHFKLSRISYTSQIFLGPIMCDLQHNLGFYFTAYLKDLRRPGLYHERVKITHNGNVTEWWAKNCYRTRLGKILLQK